MTLLFNGAEWDIETIGKAWEVIDTIGQELGLDYYPPHLEIITAEQMLEGYSSHAMPLMYQHWSFGKSFVKNEDAYKQGKMGLAYEVVINTNPMLTYLIENNTMTMQTLVICHAVCGHGSFFKNNYLFKEWTDAEYILDYLNFAKNYIKECETKYGAEQVEGLLDACHTIQYYGVDKYKRPSTLKKELAAKRAEKWQQYLDESFNELHTTVPGYKKQEIPVVTKERQFPEENLLYFIEKHSPSLKPWQREVVRIVRKISQYFYPQMQTKMMNEGWASFVHYEMMEILRERGYISDGSYMEFLCDHCNVIKQPDFNSHYYNGINPYALGISIFQDLKRVITSPTEEDKQWFPDIAGTGDYWTTLKDIVANYKDESFVLQFLSPKVIRDKKLFVLRNNEDEDHYYIDATHDEEDVYEVRDVLSKQYQLATSLPQIEITGVDWDDTRALELVHTVYDGKILDYKTAKQTLLHIKYLWGFDVLIEYKDPDGNIVERTTTDD